LNKKQDEQTSGKRDHGRPFPIQEHYAPQGRAGCEARQDFRQARSRADGGGQIRHRPGDECPPTDGDRRGARRVELEADWKVDEHLTLFSGFGYTDTEIDEFVDQFGTNTSGNELPFAPETMWNVGAEYANDLARDMTWYVRGDYVNVGDFAYEPGNNRTESYELANFRIGLRRSGWDASVWARNAFDEEYVPIAFQINPADPTQFVGENGAPGTWGITLRGSF
jgi:hypothetical protein